MDYSQAHCSVESWARKTGRCSDSKKVSYWAVKKATLMVCSKDQSLAEGVLRRNMKKIIPTLVFRSYQTQTSSYTTKQHPS